jgi:hypothetical protein
MGVTYSRSATGTGMPLKERFQTRPMGRVLCAILESKLPVLLRTAAEATQICCFGFLYIRFFGTVTIESNDVRQCKSPSSAQNNFPSAES